MCQRVFVMLVMEYFMSKSVFFISVSLFCVPERVCYVGDGIFYV